MISTKSLDLLGIGASIGCAIHCIVLPLLLTSLPVLGINILENTLFEYLMIGVAAIIGGVALSHGIRHHRRKLPVLLFTTGIVLMLGKQLWHNRELFFLLPAVVLVVSAHYFNYRFCREIDIVRVKH